MDFNPCLLKRGLKYYDRIEALKDSDIFVVRYTPTGNRFALRKTKLNECQDLEFFENEINLTNQLKHKNLLPFVSSFIDKTDLWTVMPFAEFQSLADVSTPLGLSEESISFIMRDVLNGVQYLHNNCIIHHSIRSSHILVFGSPKTEFRFVLSGLKHSISAIRSGEVLTPMYEYPTDAKVNLNWLAPEVLEQNLMGYDIKADIYSIGITCCELCNGSTPFAGLESSEMLLNKLNGEIPEPLDRNSKDLQQLSEYGGVGQLTPKMKSKYDKYMQNNYSQEFKKFVVECCLHSEPDKRLNASQLLSHHFIIKYENLNKSQTFIKSIESNDLTESIRKLI